VDFNGFPRSIHSHSFEQTDSPESSSNRGHRATDQDMNPSRPIIGLAYDPAKAQHSAHEMKSKLEALHQQVTSTPNPSHQDVEEWRKAYNSFPQTFAVNWAAGGVDESKMQAIADELRDKINSAMQVQGSNALPLRRLFNAH